MLDDQHMSRSFQEHLADGTGAIVMHAHDEGWSKLHNGRLQEVAVANDYTHLVTCDKRMANAHPPRMPVLVVDDPNDERYRATPAGKSAEALERRTRLTAAAAARYLVESPQLAKDYHAILVETLPASNGLNLVAKRRHKQHPNYGANLKHHIAEQRAKAGTKRRPPRDDGGNIAR